MLPKGHLYTRKMARTPSLSILFSIALLLTSCNFGPKATEPYTLTKVISKDLDNPEVSREMHEVVVKKIMPTDKYVYLNVEEGNRIFWIATQKLPVEEGKVYLYNESVLKTQFESKEFKRIFDTLYLVTTLVPKDHGAKLEALHHKNPALEGTTVLKELNTQSQDTNATFVGRIKIADLVKSPNTYEGKMVELSGTCTKTNLQIMGSNWIHLQDGSKDDFDLVITSNERVEKGAQVTMRGIVKLQVDFGSGYSYPLLVEQGTLVQ